MQRLKWALPANEGGRQRTSAQDRCGERERGRRRWRPRWYRYEARRVARVRRESRSARWIASGGSSKGRRPRCRVPQDSRRTSNPDSGWPVCARIPLLEAETTENAGKVGQEVRLSVTKRLKLNRSREQNRRGGPVRISGLSRLAHPVAPKAHQPPQQVLVIPFFVVLQARGTGAPLTIWV
jgi:hypothetical protein